MTVLNHFNFFKKWQIDHNKIKNPYVTIISPILAMREAPEVWAGEVILGTNPTSFNLLTALGILSTMRCGMFWLRAIVVCPPSGGAEETT